MTLARADGTGEPIPMNRGYSAADNWLNLYPYAGTTQDLEPGTEYTVTLTGGPGAIRSMDDGTPLATTSFTFTTAP